MKTLLDLRVSAKLNELHDLAAKQQQHDFGSITNAERFMAVSPEQGRFLNFIAGLNKSQHIVEFGCSFGISGIYLASAAKDNQGHLITTELEANKAGTAIQNFSEVGLSDLIDVRIGDAIQTLSDVTKADLLFLDGAKDLYLPVFKLLYPKLTANALVIADNIDKPATHDLVDFIRSSDEFTSVTLFDDRMLVAYRQA
ncbi:O-methyltransferase [Pedobacter duraquae]|uniref:Putative O-methyltransferase YrrM n=1 Tax=Pedobacter duraquae TaxID=425511 RepID=A0A4R6IFX4_9SPHI|nr:class I SAM-dependent methyltransferase [Pedobacter duraquae]TDO21260.1 putative O-methyltransferase YrrM [Pedobacter duraquae]